MKLQKIEVVNFKNLDSQSLRLNGQHVYVIGGNGRGKSSFIDAVFAVLTGADLPSKLVRDGQKNGYVCLDLGEYKVEATFTAKTEKLNLRITSPDGLSYAAPRGMLDKLVGTVQFDIAGFLAKTPRKQADYLQQLVGLDFTDLNAAYTTTFDERTFVNRRVKELEAQCPGECPAALVALETEALQRRLDMVADVAYQRANREGQQQHIAQRRTRIEARLAELQIELAQLVAEDGELQDAEIAATAWLAANPAPDASALQEELAQAHRHNAQVLAQRSELERYGQLTTARTQQQQLNAELARLESEKKARLAAKPLPVPGMSIGEDGALLLDGLPFAGNQINTARQLIAGLQICRHLHKQVPIARLDGSLLDKNSRAEVLAWADAHGLQLFVEMVDQEGGALRLEIVEAATL